MTGLHDDKLREHLYDAIERVLVYDTETIEIVWKFNEAKIDTDVLLIRLKKKLKKKWKQSLTLQLI